MRRLLFLILASLIAMPCLCARSTLLMPDRILDPASGEVRVGAGLLVEDGRIRAIGPNLSLPADCETVKLPGLTLLPGYIDCHTHLCATLQPKWDGEDFYFMALNHPTALRALEGAQHARQMLEAGFTTVRDMGNGGDNADLELARAIAWDLVPGPKVLASGRILAPFGGQFLARVESRRLELPEYAFADSQDEMRRAIRENCYYGARVIKVVAESGKAYRYSEEDLRFIREEAARAGLKVAVHCMSSETARAAVAAGVASVEHGFSLDDEVLALMKQKGVVLVSTDFTPAALMEFGVEPEKARRQHRRYVERLERAIRAGVIVAFGTDLMGSGDRGRMALEYVDSFLEAGVPPLEILRAMTTHAARLLGIEKERGTLGTGLAADLVGVVGDPLKDPQVLKHTAFVMKDGRVIRQDVRP